MIMILYIYLNEICKYIFIHKIKHIKNSDYFEVFFDYHIKIIINIV
jgi:hypothetical protein